MRNLKNRFISFMLAMVMLVSTNVANVFAQENQTITISGYTGGANTLPENHGSTSGYWDHIHALKSSGDRYSTHIWFLS